MVTRLGKGWVLVTAPVVLVAAIWFGLPLAIAAGPPRIPVPERRFDHARHERAAAMATDPRRQRAACADCHQYDGAGAARRGKEHDFRCVKCHEDPPTCTTAMKRSTPTSPGYRCVACHVMDKCKPPDVPPTPPPTFEARFSHGQHLAFGAAIERECATCHDEQAPAVARRVAGAGHALCADCHKVGGRSALVMTNCAGCHQVAGPKVAASTDAFRLGAFDHRRHHAQATRNQAACTQCHTTKKMLGTGDAAVPRPDMMTCVNECHDGRKAFSAVGTACTTCHQGQGGQVAPNRQDVAFSHAKHEARNVAIGNCVSCHPVKGDGNLEPPGKGSNHTPCATSGCHQAEFASKVTKICGICHDQSAPWQRAVSRTRESPEPEWQESINHASHLAMKGNPRAACLDCHGDKVAGGNKPGAHEPCAMCHGRLQGAHAMGECAKCHTRSLPDASGASEWSVTATFDHKRHAIDPRTRGTSDCATCHLGIHSARDVPSIRNPTMASCGQCHDGKLTFKTTGFECARCHTPRSAPRPATAMLTHEVDPAW